MDSANAYHIGQFLGSEEPEFVAWLVRILERNVQETIRRHTVVQKRALNREQPLAEDRRGDADQRHAASKQSSPSQRAMRGEDAVRLARYLEDLPDSQREAVRLRHLEGWSLGRIAEHIGRSEEAVAGLIKRGLQNLRVMIGKSGSG